LLQQYVAKNDAVFDGRKISGVAVSCTRKGLPRIIPHLERVNIRKGNVKTITLWLSLFNVYRYLECSYGSVKTDTITKPGPKFYLNEELWAYIKIFWSHINRLAPSSLKDLPQGKPFLTQKVSVAITSRDELPGTGFVPVIRSIWHWRTLVTHLTADKKFKDGKLVNVLQGNQWFRGRDLLKGLMFFVENYFPDLRSILAGLKEYTPPVLGEGSLIPWRKYIPDEFKLPNIGPYPLGVYSALYGFGRLVSLYEAAGKIRIIAIVDPLTQWVLKPLHDWIFSILKSLPQDGTFDQAKPIFDLLDLSRRSKDKFIGSCDLSAATDRLPIKLQIALLRERFGSTLAYSWAHLLISRDYYLRNKPLQYKVGQPMGALSSWASLALTNHFLWQWAAWRSGEIPTFKWFSEYAVLGDDSSSRNRKIVEEYLKICAEIGVGVNLSKSLLSRNGCFEFAKRFLTHRGDCSPVSLGELLVSKINFAVMSNWPRKRKIRLADLLTIAGYKHRTLAKIEKPLVSLPKRLRHFLIVLRSPWGSYKTDNLVQWLKMRSWNDFSLPLDITNTAIVLIEMFYELHKKSQKIVAWNALPNRLMGISRGRKKQNSATETVRKQDGNTFRAVHQVIYEPLRKQTFKDARILMTEITAVRVSMLRRVFFIEETELLEFWDKYLDLEERLHLLRTDVLDQVPKDNNPATSSRSVVKLFNRLKTPRK
jgi:hypothetical protein